MTAQGTIVVGVDGSEQSSDVDLLVVGHRGRGGFRSALLGSVGLQCVVHAYVPVTVVRPGGPESRD